MVIKHPLRANSPIAPTENWVPMPLQYLTEQFPVIQSLGFRADGLEILSRYVDALWQSNQELNLISRKMTFEELIDNHVIDCLLPLKYFPSHAKAVADFGSGGGLPAVIYAIQFSDIQFQLYEKSPLKRQFLEACRTLAPNITVLGEIPPKMNKIDLVIARGFKPLDVILEMSREYFVSGGSYFLLKARREKIDEELFLTRKKFKTICDDRIIIDALTSPVLEVERHLVRIQPMSRSF